MGLHLLFCSDLARRDGSPDRINRFEGWCIGSLPLQTLLLKIGAGEYETIPYGFSRPDVRNEFPDYANPEKSGFRYAGDFPAPPNLPVELGVRIRPEPGAPAEWHTARLRPDTRDIQTIPLGDDTRLKGAEEKAAGEAVLEPGNLEMRFRKSLRTKGGITLCLDIINKCNLRCVMCHFNDDAVFKRPTRQLTGEQFKDLFDSIGPKVGRVVLSCGNEPLTSKFLPEILRYLATEHPHVAVEFCTNAMLMHAPIRDLIMETGVTRLSLSIDAVTKPLLESIRVGCRYEQVLGNIIGLRDLKTRQRSPLPEFIFNFVMMDSNIHEAPAFVRMAKNLGAGLIDFRHLVPVPPYFVASELLSAHPAKYNFYREKIVSAAAALQVDYLLPAPFETAERWRPENESAIDFTDFERLLLASGGGNGAPLDGLPTVRRAKTLSRGSVGEDFATTYCERPFSEIMIRDQEEVLPCPWHGKTLGRLSEGKSLSEIFLGEEFAALRRNMLKPEGDPDCARCPIKTFHLPTTANN